MKQERLFIRVSKKEKAMIRKAAKELGQSIAAFVLGATYYQLASSAPLRNPVKCPGHRKKTVRKDFIELAEMILEREKNVNPRYEWAVSTLQKAKGAR